MASERLGRIRKFVVIGVITGIPLLTFFGYISYRIIEVNTFNQDVNKLLESHGTEFKSVSCQKLNDAGLEEPFCLFEGSPEQVKKLVRELKLEAIASANKPVYDDFFAAKLDNEDKIQRFASR
jgi:hypothetical protein